MRPLRDPFTYRKCSNNEFKTIITKYQTKQFERCAFNINRIVTPLSKRYMCCSHRNAFIMRSAYNTVQSTQCNLVTDGIVRGRKRRFCII